MARNQISFNIEQIIRHLMKLRKTNRIQITNKNTDNVDYTLGDQRLEISLKSKVLYIFGDFCQKFSD